MKARHIALIGIGLIAAGTAVATLSAIGPVMVRPVRPGRSGRRRECCDSVDDHILAWDFYARDGSWARISMTHGMRVRIHSLSDNCNHLQPPHP